MARIFAGSNGSLKHLDGYFYFKHAAFHFKFLFLVELFLQTFKGLYQMNQCFKVLLKKEEKK